VKADLYGLANRVSSMICVGLFDWGNEGVDLVAVFDFVAAGDRVASKVAVLLSWKVVNIMTS
jgi:hypothetical protein